MRKTNTSAHNVNMSMFKFFNFKVLDIFILLALPSVLWAQSYPLITHNPSKETQEVWCQLHAVYGKYMLTGIWTEKQDGGNARVVECSGKYPAIFGEDMNSWHAKRTGEYWIHVWNTHIADLKRAYNRGQIVQVNWHWQGPHLLNNGEYASSPSQGVGMGAWSELTTQQWNDIITPGTDLYNTMIEDIDYHVNNFLKMLVDDNGNPFPILFRPLHEIDGGWFWWTCETDPSKTVKLWNILYDRISNHHNMKNLIWVWSAGVLMNPGGSWPPYKPSEYARRKQFYPGDEKCDIAGIDLYRFHPVGRGTYFNTGVTYRQAWNMLKSITSIKMLAMCEGEALPDGDKFFDADYAPWLYCLPWFGNEYTRFTPAPEVQIPVCDWNNTQYNHKNYITADELKAFLYPAAFIRANKGTYNSLKN